MWILSALFSWIFLLSMSPGAQAEELPPEDRTAGGASDLLYQKTVRIPDSKTGKLPLIKTCKKTIEGPGAERDSNYADCQVSGTTGLPADQAGAGGDPSGIRLNPADGMLLDLSPSSADVRYRPGL